MTITCSHCGATKLSPRDVCLLCGTGPETRDESQQDLSSFSSPGRTPTVSDLLQTGGKDNAQGPAARELSPLHIVALMAVTFLIAFPLLFVTMNPWPHYQWASLWDNVQGYENFVSRFPNSEYAEPARDRIWVLSEEDVWIEANGSSNVGLLRAYREEYPEGQYLAAAEEQLQQIADERWQIISQSDSKAEVQEFLQNYPETSKTEQAEARMVEIADQRWSRLANSNSRQTVREFLRDYPETTRTEEAQSRLVEIADEKWETIAKTATKTQIFSYLRNYPETTKKEEAKARIVELVDQEWEKISQSRSLTKIRGFLTRHPEKRQEILSRIKELYHDLSWLRQQKDIKLYKDLLKEYPFHPHRKWMEKRIIDDEVRKIASGSHGKLPPSRRIQSGGSSARISVQNRTGYTLTVLYSGPDSAKLVIPVGGIRSVTLPPGSYHVAASVSASNVQNYYGQDTYYAGRYSGSFVIRRGF